MNSDLEELYQDLILEHYKHPRCRGCLDHPDASAEVFNPLCGDKINLTVAVEDHLLREIGFDGKGCAISQASASMMSEACQGKSIEQASGLLTLFRGVMSGEVLPQELEASGSDLAALQGVRKFTARIKCALLPWEALANCLKELSSRPPPDAKKH